MYARVSTHITHKNRTYAGSFIDEVHLEIASQPRVSVSFWSNGLSWMANRDNWVSGTCGMNPFRGSTACGGVHVLWNRTARHVDVLDASNKTRIHAGRMHKIPKQLIVRVQTSYPFRPCSERSRNNPAYTRVNIKTKNDNKKWS